MTCYIPVMWSFSSRHHSMGDLYVGIGSDATYLEYKHRKPMFPAGGKAIHGQEYQGGEGCVYQ